MSSANVELVRRGWEAALQGDVDQVSELFTDDLQWRGADDERNEWGCRNRTQAIRWMSERLAEGVTAELLDVRDAGEDRVVTVVQNQRPREETGELPAPHAQLIAIRDGKIAQMIVYPTPEAALAAAGV